MTDIATLKIEVKADGTAKVTQGLDKLSASSKRAQTQATKTGKAFTMMQGTVKKLAVGLGGLVGVSAVGKMLSSATSQAIAFETAMTEVSTLTNNMDMSKLTNDIRALSKEFGSDRVTQAKALYQVISAGAKTAAEAAGTLTAANKLAVGGMTDVATAADGLTSAMNAYGLGADQAGDVSDMMFVAMKAGKTTIGELSSNIGKLAPIAAQAGVGLDTLYAATAAVTKTGLDTSMTMNSLRQVIANILKPTKEASDVAQELGLSFNAAALESKGLVGMLKEVREKTGGSTELLTKLFGSVESLGSVMHLTSAEGGKDFLDILEQMDKRAGATDEAFKKVSETTGFLAGRLGQQLKDAMLGVGISIAEKLNPLLIKLVANFDDVAASAKLLGQILLTGVLAQGILKLPAALALIVSGLGKATLAMKTFTLAMMKNPFGLIAVGISTAIAAALVFKNEIVTVGKTTATVGEWVAGTWKVLSGYIKTSIDAITDAWNKAWKAMKEPVTKFAKGFTAVFTKLLAGLWDMFTSWTNSVIGAWGWLLEKFGIEIDLVIPKSDALGASFSATWDAIADSGAAGEAVGFIKDVATEINYTVTQMQDLETASLHTGEALTEVAGAALTDVGNAATNAAYSGDELAASLSHARNVSRDLKKSTEEVVTQLDGPFAEALQHTAERIDAAFSDAWKDIGNGFDSFTKSMVSAFGDMLAEMAHLALTRPIAIAITSAMGMGASAGASAAGAAGGGLLGSAGSGLMGLFSGGMSAFGNSLYSSATNLGLDTFAMAGRGQEMLQSMGFAGMDAGINFAANAAANLGAGLAGGYLGNKAFGDTSGAGAALGGLAGTYLGAGNPLFTALGSFIGTGLERALGNVFGFGGKKGNNIGYADLSTGATGGYGTYNKDNESAAGEIAGMLQSVADVFGEDLKGRIEVSDRGWVRYQNKKYTQVDELIEDVLDQLINSSDALSDRIRTLAQGFDGTTEETLAFTTALMSIESVLANNPIEMALKDMAAAQEEAAMSVMDVYDRQINYTTDLVDSYDGTAESAANLANALATTGEMAYQLVVAITQAGIAMQDMFTNSAQAIRESVMTPDELVAGWRAERDQTLELLRQATDPSLITEYATRWNELNNKLYNSLSDDEQRATTTEGQIAGMTFDEPVTTAESYAQAAELVSDLTAERLGIAMDNVAEKWSVMVGDVDEVLNNAAQVQQVAADTMANATNRFADYVQFLVNNGVRVRLEGGGEVNA